MDYKITRVWGKADSFDIEFTYIGGTRWKASVPPDKNDGVYAVGIWAMNEYGEVAYWAGELFMCGGVCCLNIHQSAYQIWFLPFNYRIEVSERGGFEVDVKPRKYHLELLDRMKLIIRKECSHV